jgi:hypothetical protein
MIDLTPIINAIIVLLATLITAFVVPLLKTKLGEEKYNKMLMYAEIAVNAAEQIYGIGHGKEKLDYAIKYLESKGYKADRTAIEAMVKTMFTDKPKEEKYTHENTDEVCYEISD